MSPETIAGWIAAFGARLPARRPLRIADVGSGTGRFSPPLADAFGGLVYGIEPSDRMRAVAERDRAHPNIQYRRGRCESVPLGDNAVDATEFLQGTGMARLLFEGADAETERKAIAAVRGVLEAHEQPEGVWLDSAAWLVTATRA